MPRLARGARPGLMAGIKQFIVEKLPEQLSRFEKNVSDALDSQRSYSLDSFDVFTAPDAIYLAHVGDLVKVPGACVVHLPVASPQNAGWGMVAVNRQSATGAVTVDSSVGQLVNGVATDTLPAALGTWLFVSLGDGWGRIGNA